MKVPTDLAVCIDCVAYLANGEVQNGRGTDITTAQRNAMVHVWGEGFDITLGTLECDYCRDSEEDCEPWFSWRRCDGCESHLGGDRSHATAWTD